MENINLGSNNPDEIVKKLDEIKNFQNNDTPEQQSNSDVLTNKVFDSIQNYKKTLTSLNTTSNKQKNKEITTPFFYIASNLESVKNSKKQNQIFNNKKTSISNDFNAALKQSNFKLNRIQPEESLKSVFNYNPLLGDIKAQLLNESQDKPVSELNAFSKPLSNAFIPYNNILNNESQINSSVAATVPSIVPVVTEDETEIPEEPKRKRGRPKKVIAVDEEPKKESAELITDASLKASGSANQQTLTADLNDTKAIQILKKIYNNISKSNEYLKDISKNITLIEKEDVDIKEHEKHLKEANESARLNEHTATAKQHTVAEPVHSTNEEEKGIEEQPKEEGGGLFSKFAETATAVGTTALALPELAVGGAIVGAGALSGYLFENSFNGAADDFRALKDQGIIDYSGFTPKVLDWEKIKQLPVETLQRLINSKKFSPGETQKLSYFVRLKKGEIKEPTNIPEQKDNNQKSSYVPVIRDMDTGEEIHVSNDDYVPVIRDMDTGEETHTSLSTTDINDIKDTKNINIDGISIKELNVEKFNTDEFTVENLIIKGVLLDTFAKKSSNKNPSAPNNITPTNKSSEENTEITSKATPVFDDGSKTVIEGKSRSDSQKEFYNNMYNSLLKAGKEKGLENPEVIARLGADQASLESGYGTSNVYNQTNNPFGITASKGDEFYQAGTGYKFKKYKSMEDAAPGYIDFLTKNKSGRYNRVLAAKTIEEAIAEQQKTGYAGSDIEYGSKLAILDKTFDWQNAKKIDTEKNKISIVDNKKEEFSMMKEALSEGNQVQNIPEKQNELDKLSKIMNDTRSMAEANIKQRTQITNQAVQQAAPQQQNISPISKMMNVRNDDPLLLTLQYGNLRTV